jgi:hypothetical protein
VGTWSVRDSATGRENRISFFPFNERELVAVSPGDDANPVASVFRVFTTPIGAERFLNIQELQSAPGEWYYARYTIDGNRLVLTLVDDGLFDGVSVSSADELRELIRAHLDDPRLYTPAGEERQDMVMVRVPPD